jgi:hypothetical protein
MPMSERLQQATVLIKSGKNQEAQQLLAKLLSDEPNNDQAWLWMSAVAPAEKRRYCIEKALSINPNNLQARQALNRLTQPPATVAVNPPQPQAATNTPVTPPQAPATHQPSAVVAPSTTPPVANQARPEIWVNKQKSIIYITILTGTEIVTGILNPGLAKQAQAQLQQNKLPLEMMIRPKRIPLNRIAEIRETLATVTVKYTEDSKPESEDLMCKDGEMADAMLNALESRFGGAFVRMATPVEKGAILGVAGLVSIVILAVTAFFYWGALEVAAGSRPTGRGSSLAWLLEMLGPNGVMCIGGVVLLLAVVVTAVNLKNPPLTTKLLPKSAYQSQVQR